MPSVTVYGTGWCPDVRLARRTLDEAGISYDYIDIDADGDAENRVLRWNAGRRRVPTIVVQSSEGQQVLSNPPREELAALVNSLGNGEKAAVK
ncbi:MAG: glutaredoxin family protein [Acidobacteria bacterium]|nr:glutaredoxin family protein [Acidobacteriota bacterium]